MAEESELDRLDPQPTEVELVSGFTVEVVRLKTRQLFRLLRILTKGAADQLGRLDFSAGPDSFGAQLLAIIIMAVPEAEAETIGFLQSMAQPAGLIEKSAAELSKKEAEHNKALFERFADEMFNPELEDTIALFEVIVQNEAPELQALGKKLAKLWTVAKAAVGKAEPELKAETPQALHSREATPASSTSLPTSTDGPTSTSSTSHSAGSGRRRKQPSTAAV